MKTGNGLTKRLVCIVALVLLFAVHLFPIYWMANTSIKPNEAAFQTPPRYLPDQPTLGS